MATAADLVAQYKKCGAFDEQRAKLFEQLAQSDYIKTLKEQIAEAATKEVEQQLQLLDGDRSKSTSILEGAVTRSVLQSTENTKTQQEAFDKAVAEARKEVLVKLRSLQPNEQ